MKARWLSATVLVLTVAMGACSSGKTNDEAHIGTAAPGSSTSTTNGGTTSTSAGTATSTSAAPLTGGLNVHADGRFPARLKAADTPSRTLVVDEIQFLTGDAAKKAYIADNGGTEGPDNDYYIKNVNPLLTTVKVSPTAKITVNVLANTSTDDQTIDFATLAGYLRDQPDLATSQPFWITVAGGVGTIVEEQFIP